MQEGSRCQETFDSKCLSWSQTHFTGESLSVFIGVHPWPLCLCFLVISTSSFYGHEWTPMNTDKKQAATLTVWSCYQRRDSTRRLNSAGDPHFAGICPRPRLNYFSVPSI